MRTPPCVSWVQRLYIRSSQHNHSQKSGTRQGQGARSIAEVQNGEATFRSNFKTRGHRGATVGRRGVAVGSPWGAAFPLVFQWFWSGVAVGSPWGRRGDRRPHLVFRVFRIGVFPNLFVVPMSYRCRQRISANLVPKRWKGRTHQTPPGPPTMSPLGFANFLIRPRTPYNASAFLGLWHQAS